MTKKKPQHKAIANRRARYDYQLDGSLVAGLVLSGREVRALRLGHGQLTGAYVTPKNGELWLINATISGSHGNPITDTEQTQARKVLLKQREINALTEARQQGRTIIPLEILTGGRFIKLRIAMGKGRKTYDKRQAIKQREADRSARSAIQTTR